MALKTVQAATLNDTEADFTVGAPLAAAAISTVLDPDGVTIVIGNTASKDSNSLITCIERLRDHLKENS